MKKKINYSLRSLNESFKKFKINHSFWFKKKNKQKNPLSKNIPIQNLKNKLIKNKNYKLNINIKNINKYKIIINEIKNSINRMDDIINLNLDLSYFRLQLKIIAQKNINIFKLKMKLFKTKYNHKFNYKYYTKNFIDAFFKLYTIRYTSIKNFIELKFLNNKLLKLKSIIKLKISQKKNTITNSSIVYTKYNYSSNNTRFFKLFSNNYKNLINKEVKEIEVYKKYLKQFDRRKSLLLNNIIKYKKGILNYDNNHINELKLLKSLKIDKIRNSLIINNTSRKEITKFSFRSTFYKKFYKTVSLNVSDTNINIIDNNTLLKYLFKIGDYNEAKYLKVYIENNVHSISFTEIKEIFKSYIYKFSFHNLEFEDIIEKFYFIIKKKKFWNIYEIFHHFNNYKNLLEFDNYNDSIKFARFLIEDENFTKFSILKEQDSNIIVSIFNNIFKGYKNLKPELWCNYKSIVNFIKYNRFELSEIFYNFNEIDLFKYKNYLISKNFRVESKLTIDIFIYFLYENLDKDLIISKNLFFTLLNKF